MADPAASNPNNPTATDPGAEVKPTEGTSSGDKEAPPKGTMPKPSGTTGGDNS